MIDGIEDHEDDIRHMRFGGQDQLIDLNQSKWRSMKYFHAESLKMMKSGWK